MSIAHAHTAARSRWVHAREPKASVQSKRTQRWTRPFFHGEPQPWHRAAAVFGLVTVAIYLAWIVVVPLFFLG